MWWNGGSLPDQTLLALLMIIHSFCFLTVEHTANCTTDGILNITCTYPAVSSIVSLVVDGDIQDFGESNAGVTQFLVPYISVINASIICRVNHSSDIHESSPFTVGKHLHGLIMLGITV